MILANRGAENPKVVWHCQILNYIIGPFSHTGMDEWWIFAPLEKSEEVLVKPLQDIQFLSNKSKSSSIRFNITMNHSLVALLLIL